MTKRPSASAEEVAHLSTGSAAVQTLKAQLDKVPETRQQKVDSLKQAIAEGRHRRNPRKIAAAMFADGIPNLV
jgi:flagellar biosynthesis anti-sigma factor FlgM